MMHQGRIWPIALHQWRRNCVTLFGTREFEWLRIKTASAARAGRELRPIDPSTTNENPTTNGSQSSESMDGPDRRLSDGWNAANGTRARRRCHEESSSVAISFHIIVRRLKGKTNPFHQTKSPNRNSHIPQTDIGSNHSDPTMGRCRTE
jgi:hypothetical protein